MSEKYEGETSAQAYIAELEAERDANIKARSEVIAELKAEVETQAKMLRLAMEEQGGLRPDPDWMICNTADEYIANLRTRAKAEMAERNAT